MKDLIWDIAKSGEEALENTELQSIEEPKELFVARGVSLEAKDSTIKLISLLIIKLHMMLKKMARLKSPILYLITLKVTNPRLLI